MYSKYMHRLFLKFPIFILLIFSIGCTAKFSKMDSKVSVVPLPEENWVNVAWIDQWLILQKSEGSKYSQSLWRVKIDGSNLEELDLFEYPNCEKIGFKYPSRLPNGELGYFVSCGFQDLTKPSLQYLVSYDLETEESKPLVTYSLESNGKISWNPDMSKGITSVGSILVNQLYWFTSESSQEIVLEFTTQAFGASWSPDGQQIAFVAAPHQNRSGIDLLDSNYNIYLMDYSGENIHSIVNKFKHTSGLRWSPDGNYLVFDGTFPFSSPSPYLYSINTGIIHKIAEGNFEWYEWSPDSSQIISIRISPDGVDFPDEVVIIQPLGIGDDLD